MLTNHRSLWATLSLLAMLLANPVWSDERLEIIQLTHRTASELLTVLTPLVEPSGTIQAFDDKLIIRADEAIIAQIQTLVDQLDTPPKQVLITVWQGADLKQRELAAKAGGHWYKNEKGQLTVSVGGGKTDKSQGDLQQVRTLDGREAVIYIGQRIPVASGLGISKGREIIVIDGVHYRDVVTGFRVKPSIRGDRVELEIRPQRETNGTMGLPTEIQAIDTVIAGPLNEWIEIGGLSQRETVTGSGTVYATRQSSADQRRVWVKVEPIPDPGE
ncbi:MAG: secretin N-terminal domain-containing protein [Pseudomonadota bacterium]|nr:secretin N-terminal domain-containing protein [Pseudomonadota bacterium]